VKDGLTCRFARLERFQMVASDEQTDGGWLLAG
jgi:hypothetical protein